VSTTSQDHLPAVTEADPLPDPGLSHHHPRPTDVDEAAERRAERQVATYFVLSMVSAVMFVVAYFTLDIKASHDTFLGLGASTVSLGTALGLMLLFIGIGVIQLARKLMGDHEIIELRHPASSSEEDREATVAALSLGLEESGLGRRKLVRNTLIGAMGMAGLPLIVGLRDLYPEPIKGTIGKLEKTVWATGTRIVNDVTGRWIHISDMEIGQLVNAEPEGLVHEHDPRADADYLAQLEADGKILHGVDLQVAKTKAAVIVVRMEPKDITEATANWGTDGIVAYSKICTHVGCPISLWEQQTHHLLCPCHQSTFDLADKGRVVFGPAARSLPQLPIEADGEGFLIARSGFEEPVGPSYWERG
jgi:ubiquinol-cytochrome c reductase iron-sulfur subunit